MKTQYRFHFLISRLLVITVFVSLMGCARVSLSEDGSSDVVNNDAKEDELAPTPTPIQNLDPTVTPEPTARPMPSQATRIAEAIEAAGGERKIKVDFVIDLQELETFPLELYDAGNRVKYTDPKGLVSVVFPEFPLDPNNLPPEAERTDPYTVSHLDFFGGYRVYLSIYEPLPHVLTADDFLADLIRPDNYGMPDEVNEITVNGLEGRDVVWDITDTMEGLDESIQVLLRARIFLIERQVYLLVAEGSNDNIIGGPGNEFMNSFEYLGPPP